MNGSRRKTAPVTISHTKAPLYTDVHGNPFPEPGDEMVTVTVMVTPEMARDFATRPMPRFANGKPIRQRKPSPTHIVKIAGWLERDEWMLSPEGFAFTPDGGMIEGLQRCMAIDRTGIAAPVRITFNVPAELFPILNQGKNRTAKDVAEISGVEQYSTLFATGIKLLNVWLRFEEDPENQELANWTWWSRIYMSPTQQVATQLEHPGFEELMAEAAKMKRGSGVNDGAAAVFLYIAERAWPESVTRRTIRSGEGEDEKIVKEGPLIKFRDQVTDGEMIKRGDPAFTLTKWLDTGHGAVWDARFRRQAHLAGLLQAWGAFCRGEKLTEIRLLARNGRVLPMEAPYRPE